MRAFNLSERFQVPVIILSDQSIGFRKATVRLPDFAEIREVEWPNIMDSPVIPSAKKIELASRIEPGPEELKNYLRFRDTADGISPITRPGLAGGQYLATGIEHTENGHPDYSPEVHFRMTAKRFRKLDVLSKVFEKNPPEYYGSRDAKIGVIGWGSTEGAIREARYMAESEGVLVRHLHPKVISPLPDRQIRYFLAELKHVIIAEENYTGQFAHFVSGKFGIRPIELHKCQGLPLTSREVFTSIMKVARIVDDQNIAGL
jgi:2-oxoglutarate ferredoxin oxidoreductase subunit alpha